LLEDLMYTKVLLPTDGAEGFDEVASHAGSIAREYGATVHVISVADTRNRFESPSSGLAPDAWMGSEHEHAEEAVEDAAAALPGDVPVETVVEEGVPHSVILDYAEAAGVDLVVMGTHGRQGVDHYLMGSVAERVVRKARVPVLTVRANR
jgi:nucleotide-binding universal stress UspA family protein